MDFEKKQKTRWVAYTICILSCIFLLACLGSFSPATGPKNGTGVNGGTTSPLGLLFLYLFDIAWVGAVISGIIYFFDIVITSIIFRGEKEKNIHIRRARVPMYKKDAQEEIDKGFRLSFKIGYVIAVLFVFLYACGIYNLNF